MKEKLQLLIVSQNPDELGPLNVSIWLKENEMSSGQSNHSTLRIEYSNNNIILMVMRFISIYRQKYSVREKMSCTVLLAKKVGIENR